MKNYESRERERESKVGFAVLRGNCIPFLTGAMHKDS